MTDRGGDTPELDVEFARAHFPALADGWAFFENAGGSYVPRSVIERVTAYMTESQVQPGAGYAPSAAAAERMAEGRLAVAQMINADADEVLVGPSTTANVYALGHAIRPWLEPGDEVVVTDLDHEANNGAWRRLAEIGAVVKEWRVDPATAELDPAALEPLLGPRTRLVCVTHCSNITGAFNDIAAIARMVHAAGGLLFVDGVAFAPHRAIDVRALDVDFYGFSPYKVYGPHLGVLYGKREHLIAAEGQNHFFFRAGDVPDKIAPGYANHELTAGLAGIADYFDQLHAHHFALCREQLSRARVRRVRAVRRPRGAAGGPVRGLRRVRVPDPADRARRRSGGGTRADLFVHGPGNEIGGASAQARGRESGDPQR